MIPGVLAQTGQPPHPYTLQYAVADWLDKDQSLYSQL